MARWHGLACGAVLAAAACGAPADDPSATAETPLAGTAGDPQSRPWFDERAAASGLQFRHVNGASGRFYYPEILGPGVAFLDFDNDGDLDAYLVQGDVLGTPPPGDVWVPPAGAPVGGRLFRNDLPAGGASPGLRFTDVTEASGIRAGGFGLGVATGDVDNDGWTDLYLTRFGPAQLWRNRGDGTFADITAASGTANTPGFGVSASFFDYDRDGWLDLYVGNNVDYRLTNEKACPGPSGARDYCPPQIYGGTPDRLFRNRGGGRFEDVTTRVLQGGKFGPALGVVAVDVDRDGWTDVYVANDGEPNLLWMNQRDGTFREQALVAGAALTAEGRAESSMGVAAGDFDNDGDDDLLLTELTGEGSNLFLHDGTGRFRDISAPAGVAAASMRYTGWGTAWVDVDNDGWLDSLGVNGTIIAVGPRAGPRFPYDQQKLLLRNLGTGRFEDARALGGPALETSAAGRGAAFGDVDNDGDVDVLVGNNAGTTELLVNQVGAARQWIGVRVVGTAGRRDMLGARVAIRRANGATVWRRAHADGSYASANDPRVLVGLGDDAGPVGVEVRWPDGRVETWTSLPVNRWHTLEQGAAR